MFQTPTFFRHPKFSNYHYFSHPIFSHTHLFDTFVLDSYVFQTHISFQTPIFFRCPFFQTLSFFRHHLFFRHFFVTCLWSTRFMNSNADKYTLSPVLQCVQNYRLTQSVSDVVFPEKSAFQIVCMVRATSQLCPIWGRVFC